MKKVFIKIYLLKDSHGNTNSVTVEEGSDNCQVGGLKDIEGNDVYLESRAYEISSWIVGKGIELKVIEMEEDFDTLWERTK